MIISRQDLLFLSADNSELLEKVYSDPIGALKTIKQNGKLDIFEFYNKLRKNYNDKHSKIYINVMKEVEDPKKVLTTLSALVTQILLYSEHLNNKNIFMKHSNFSEILKALQEYAETQNLIPCVEIIRTIKQDIKQVEQL